jgi:hypothetical protein
VPLGVTLDVVLWVAVVTALLGRRRRAGPPGPVGTVVSAGVPGRTGADLSVRPPEPVPALEDA